jgi:hypothetical protein
MITLSPTDQVVPFAIDANKTKEADQCVSHQGNTTTLRGTIEECNLGSVSLQGVCKVHGCFPCVWMDGTGIVIQAGDLSFAIDINTNPVAVLKHQTRLIAWAKFSGIVSLRTF